MGRECAGDGYAGLFSVLLMERIGAKREEETALTTNFQKILEDSKV